MGAHGGTVGALGPLGELLVLSRLGVGDGVAGLRVAQFRLLQRQGLAHVLDHRLHLARVRVEQKLHELQVVTPVRRSVQRRLDVIQVAAGGVPAVEAHVAGGLLQRRHADARVFQDLGGHVGDVLASHVGAAELRHRVVAVAHEHPVVKGAGAAHRRVVGCCGLRYPEGGGEVGVSQELVQERAPEVPGRAAVAGEERSGHLLGQAQAEDRPVHVGEEGREPLALRGTEGFHGCRARSERIELTVADRPDQVKSW